MNIEQYIKIAFQAMDDKAAEDIKILKLIGISSISDYFLIGSASNERLVKAISQNVEKELSLKGLEPKSVEGEGSSNWILMDYGDFIVNIFKNEERQFYNLERLWKDAPYVEPEVLEHEKVGE